MEASCPLKNEGNAKGIVGESEGKGYEGLHELQH